MIYLACPYSHPEPAIRENRYFEANAAAARLMAQGHVVFSPISHSHAVADHLPDDLRCSWDFWKTQDLPILERCSKVIVLKLEGWTESVGVQAEISHALRKSIPVFYMEVPRD